MKKVILLLAISLGLNSLVAQVNNNAANPNMAPNSGVQTPTPGAQTTGPDFQPTTPYVQAVPSATVPNTVLIPSTQTITPQINTTFPSSSGTDNSLNTNPTNTLAPGSPTSPPRK